MEQPSTKADVADLTRHLERIEALGSIPAIFGLTQNVVIVFTATAFSLLGLRQLYFLLDGLLDRLVHLTYGLAAILAFIGVKLVLHAGPGGGRRDRRPPCASSSRRPPRTPPRGSASSAEAPDTGSTVAGQVRSTRTGRSSMCC